MTPTAAYRSASGGLVSEIPALSALSVPQRLYERVISVKDGAVPRFQTRNTPCSSACSVPHSANAVMGTGRNAAPAAGSRCCARALSHQAQATPSWRCCFEAGPAQRAVLPSGFVKHKSSAHQTACLSRLRRRYLLRVTIQRPYNASIVRDFPFWVRNYAREEPVSGAPQPPVKASMLPLAHHQPGRRAVKNLTERGGERRFGDAPLSLPPWGRRHRRRTHADAASHQKMTPIALY